MISWWWLAALAGGIVLVMWIADIIQQWKGVPPRKSPW